MLRPSPSSCSFGPSDCSLFRIRITPQSVCATIRDKNVSTGYLLPVPAQETLIFSAVRYGECWSSIHYSPNHALEALTGRQRWTRKQGPRRKREETWSAHNRHKWKTVIPVIWAFRDIKHEIERQCTNIECSIGLEHVLRLCLSISSAADSPIWHIFDSGRYGWRVGNIPSSPTRCFLIHHVWVGIRRVFLQFYQSLDENLDLQRDVSQIESWQGGNSKKYTMSM